MVAATQGALKAIITRTTRTPAFWGYPPPPHDYPYHWVILDTKSKEDKVKVTNLKNSPKFQIFDFRNGHYTRHTFWSCLIRCANMKWIWWVLLKIQSGHDSVHRRTDGQGDTSIPPFQLRWSGGYNECLEEVGLTLLTWSQRYIRQQRDGVNKMGSYYLPRREAWRTEKMSAGLDPHVLVVLGADLAELEGGAHLTVELVLLLRHLNVVLGEVRYQEAQVGVHRTTVRIQVATQDRQ